MGLSKAEYLKLITKEVVAPSGLKCTIRKASIRNKLLEGKMPVLNSTSIRVDTGTQTKTNDSEQTKEQLRFANELIVDSVIDPKISLKPNENDLCIDVLSDEDSNFLIEEISKFSFGKRQDLKSFRKE